MATPSNFVVHPTGQSAMLIQAPGLLAAFGEAVQRRGMLADLTRLAFEVKPDGSAVVLDVVAGLRFQIRPI